MTPTGYLLVDPTSAGATTRMVNPMNPENSTNPWLPLHVLVIVAATAVILGPDAVRSGFAGSALRGLFMTESTLVVYRAYKSGSLSKSVPELYEGAKQRKIGTFDSNLQRAAMAMGLLGVVILALS